MHGFDKEHLNEGFLASFGFGCRSVFVVEALGRLGFRV